MAEILGFSENMAEDAAHLEPAMHDRRSAWQDHAQLVEQWRWQMLLAGG